MTGVFSKIVAGDRYFHVQQLEAAPDNARLLVERACTLAKAMPADDFKVVRIAHDEARVSLLHYPSFFVEAFSTLRRYWSIDIAKGVCQYRTYEDSFNPPLLHRMYFLMPGRPP